MNANELADELEDWYEGNQIYDTDPVPKAATMLRQQQAEIAELKHINKNWQISENILLLELEKLQHCELTDDVIEQVRVAIMGAAYWCADENMPEAYNAVKVCCGQVLGILDKAQEK
jgi:hypothetical protein